MVLTVMQSARFADGRTWSGTTITALIAELRWMDKICGNCDWCTLNFCLCGKSKKREVKPEDTCKHWWQYETNESLVKK